MRESFTIRLRLGRIVAHINFIRKRLIPGAAIGRVVSVASTHYIFFTQEVFGGLIFVTWRCGHRQA